MSLTPAPEDSQIPLAYAIARPPRPGILTAVGIVSIVLGGMSVLAGLAWIATGIMYMALSNMRLPMPTPSVRVTGSASAATPGSPTTYYSYSSGVNTTVVVPGTTGMTSTPSTTMISPFRIATGASILMIVEAALSICLAAFLIYAGIAMLRDSPKAPRLHRIYVALKIPLIAMSAIAIWWTYSGLMNNFSAITAGTPGAAAMPAFGNTMAVVQAIVWAGIGMLYPIALLIVLSTQTSRRHFGAIQSGVAA
jgi:hypothetical protein